MSAICLSLARIWLFPHSEERSAEWTGSRLFSRMILSIGSICPNRLIDWVCRVFMSMIANLIQPFVIGMIVIILLNLLLWEKIQSFQKNMFSLKVCVFAAYIPIIPYLVVDSYIDDDSWLYVSFLGWPKSSFNSQHISFLERIDLLWAKLTQNGIKTGVLGNDR